MVFAACGTGAWLTGYSLMTDGTVADIMSEIRAHRAEYREGQRRLDEQALELRATVTGMAHCVRDLERDMAMVKVQLNNQAGLADRLQVAERRQSWLFGAASVMGAGLSWLSRKLFG